MNWKLAEGVPNHWLPISGTRDYLTGFYAVALKPNGKLEACSAPGLWAELTDQSHWKKTLGV